MSEPILLPIGPRPAESVVNLLEDVLRMAKDGDITAVAIVLVHRGRKTSGAWTSGADYHLLNSGAARLATKLAMDDDHS